MQFYKLGLFLGVASLGVLCASQPAPIGLPVTKFVDPEHIVKVLQQLQQQFPDDKDYAEASLLIPRILSLQTNPEVLKKMKSSEREDQRFSDMKSSCELLMTSYPDPSDTRPLDQRRRVCMPQNKLFLIAYLANLLQLNQERADEAAKKAKKSGASVPVQKPSVAPAPTSASSALPVKPAEAAAPSVTPEPVKSASAPLVTPGPVKSASVSSVAPVAQPKPGNSVAAPLGRSAVVSPANARQPKPPVVAAAGFD